MEQQQHLSLSSALNKVRLEFAMTGFAARRRRTKKPRKPQEESTFLQLFSCIK